MKQQIKNCQNCKKDFTIESEDFKFYEKMGFKYLSSKDKKSDTRLMYFNLESIS